MEQMRDLERQGFVAGTSEAELQRRAAAAVADAIQRLVPEGKAVTALVGPGNNGRDAWIAADKLRAVGWQATVILSTRHAVNDDELTAFSRPRGRRTPGRKRSSEHRCASSRH